MRACVRVCVCLLKALLVRSSPIAPPLQQEGLPPVTGCIGALLPLPAPSNSWRGSHCATQLPPRPVLVLVHGTSGRGHVALSGRAGGSVETMQPGSATFHQNSIQAEDKRRCFRPGSMTAVTVGGCTRVHARTHARTGLNLSHQLFTELQCYIRGRERREEAAAAFPRWKRA